MTANSNSPMTYFARLLPGGNPDRPDGILRILRSPKVVCEEEFASTGVWVPTDFFRQPEPRPDQARAVVITAGDAAVVIHRWREEGLVPFVEGVLIPPLPRSPGPAPAPGVGPVSPAAAQAIADEWVGDSELQGGVYEFDLGYIVYSRKPAVPSGPSRLPEGVGAGRGVIDRATGILSVWPNLPFPQIAELYRNRIAELYRRNGIGGTGQR